jgi:hypothetical protein
METLALPTFFWNLDTLKNTNKFSDVDIEMFVSPILEKLNLPLPQPEKQPVVRVLLSEEEVERAISKCCNYLDKRGLVSLN